MIDEQKQLTKAEVLIFTIVALPKLHFSTIKFSLPGKKSLLNSELDTDLIVMESGQVQLKDLKTIRKDFIAENKKSIP